jgi:hypothetical protein
MSFLVAWTDENGKQQGAEFTVNLRLHQVELRAQIDPLTLEGGSAMRN